MAAKHPHGKKSKAELLQLVDNLSETNEFACVQYEDMCREMDNARDVMEQQQAEIRRLTQLLEAHHINIGERAAAGSNTTKHSATSYPNPFNRSGESAYDAQVSTKKQGPNTATSTRISGSPASVPETTATKSTSMIPPRYRNECTRHRCNRQTCKWVHVDQREQFASLIPTLPWMADAEATKRK